jgi:hypothetical protein
MVRARNTPVMQTGFGEQPISCAAAPMSGCHSVTSVTGYDYQQPVTCITTQV